MSVLIKGMDMPVCLSCDFCNVFVEQPYCRRLMEITPKTSRLADCPLKEVKTPHGRLVEAKAVKEQIDKWLNTLGEAIIGQYYFELLRCIDDAPTVIEAEEEEE